MMLCSLRSYITMVILVHILILILFSMLGFELGTSAQKDLIKPVSFVTFIKMKQAGKSKTNAL